MTDPQTSNTSDSPFRVLLVEDDVRLAREVAHYLECHGLSVRILHRGELAVAAAQQVDIVLLDWMLPGVDGLTVCRAIRAVTTLPILMLTAREVDASEVRALEEGADDSTPTSSRSGCRSCWTTRRWVACCRRRGCGGPAAALCC